MAACSYLRKTFLVVIARTSARTRRGPVISGAGESVALHLADAQRWLTVPSVRGEVLADRRADNADRILRPEREEAPIDDELMDLLGRPGAAVLGEDLDDGVEDGGARALGFARHNSATHINRSGPAREGQ